MDTNVALALIALATVFVTGTVTPIAVGYFQYRVRKAERVKDIQRQDDVAEATKVFRSETDTKLDSLKELADSTHGLVNSRTDALLQSTHDALVGQRESMKDIIELRRKSGTPPTEDAIATLATLTRRIEQLQAVITSRAAAAAA